MVGRLPLIPLFLLLLLAGCSVGDTAALDVYDSAEGFWSAPWPSDDRVGAEGRPDMSDFPIPEGADLFAEYVDAFETLDGFSLNAPAFFRFSARLPTNDLPLPEDSLRKSSRVQWIDISPDSPSYGERIPVELDVKVQDFTHSDPHTLIVRPPLGFPLRSSTTYAVIVLQSFGDANGDWLQPSETVKAKLEAAEGSWGLLDDYLRTGPQRPARGRIAAATVFTTQDVFTELEAVEQHVRADSTYPEFVSAGDGWPEGLNAPFQPPPGVTFLHGVYRQPNYQQGDPPYANEGGEFGFDGDGTPLVGMVEEVHWLMSVPIGDPPEGGWPLCVYMHGTGGDRGSFARAGPNRPSTLMTRRGIATLSIDQPLHGARRTGEYNVELMSFNLFNPASARTIFRQGAIDSIALIEFAQRHMVDGGVVVQQFANAEINPERIVYLGHSQGGLTGSMMLGLPNGYKGAALSGAGGGLTATILERKDLLDFEALFRNSAGIPEDEPFDRFHPVLAVIQGIVDVTDPLSHSPRWWEASGSANGILLLEGLLDEATPATTSEALAAGAGIPIIKPVVAEIPELELRGIFPVDAPLSDNIELPDGTTRTAGLHQNAEHGHFLLFENETAAVRVSDFLRSASNDNTTIR